jgi:hypothetical protein
MKPDESLFRSHLTEAPFVSGVDAEKWGLVEGSISWPNATMWVSSSKKILPAGRIFLRFDLEGYPSAAPTSFPWDEAKMVKLDTALFPKVDGKFKLVFRFQDWQGGNALYAPCDRIAMSGHEGWKTQFPRWWWQPTFTITKYLEFVHMVLNPVTYDE